MNVKEAFKEFCENLKISNPEDISTKYKNITQKLNESYWGNSSKINHSLQVGSIGRKTAINGISDLDMLFEIPKYLYEKYDNYASNGQSALLQDVKSKLSERYPKTQVSGDGQVVVVKFKTVKVEVLPAYPKDDDSYYFPDSNGGGCWKITKPRPEIAAINELNKVKNYNLKPLCRMIRAWKNKQGINMSGLLIDTFCYNFLNSTEYYDDKEFLHYNYMLRDFFEYLMNLDDKQEHWPAPGSQQYVYKKDKFVKKAKKANKAILEAIDKNDQKNVNNKWRKLFGSSFPANATEDKQTLIEKTASFGEITDNEQFIEDMFPVDINQSLEIDCLVTQDGFRIGLLKSMSFLRTNKELKFFIVRNSVEKPYQVKWKIRNVGDIAYKRNCLRGEIIDDQGKEFRKETSNFSGKHFVECYIIKDEICVAMDRIEVPISKM